MLKFFSHPDGELLVFVLLPARVLSNQAVAARDEA